MATRKNLTAPAAGNNWKKAIIAGVIAPCAIALFVLAFLWPMATMTPKDMPVAIVGSEAQVGAVSTALDAAKPGLMEIHTASSREEAISLIEKREVYGAIVLGQQPEIVYSSAAGAQQAAILKGLETPLTQMANQQTQAAGVAQRIPADQIPAITVTATDVVPLSSEDPSGIGMNMSIIPIAIGGVIVGAIASFMLKRPAERILAVILASGIGGMVAAGVLGGIFGLLPAGFWAMTGVFSLGILAVSSFIAGMRSLIGVAGFPLAALAIMLVGNLLAGTMAPKEFVAGGWGYFGQFFPNGATATLVRVANYFPDASVSQPVWVLVAWIALGFALLAAAWLRTPVPAAVAAPVRVDEPGLAAAVAS